jgi:damage-control phosphatase, subfamily I
MKTTPECVSCFMKQALLATRQMTDDPDEAINALKRAAEFIISISREKSPAEQATPIAKAVRSYFGNENPFREEKQRYNALALSVYDALVAYVHSNHDSLEAATRIAAVGNIMDLGIFANIDVEATVEQAKSTVWALNHIEHLKRDTAAARHILYLGDNAGEIVFDRVLVEVLPPHTVTFAVKSGPIANDVTRDDAVQSGMDQVAEIMETGSDYMGVPLPLCSDEFLEAFHSADVIIAKGMANFETLSDVDANIFFILKTKCDSVAQEIGVIKEGIVLMAQKARLSPQDQ